MSETNSLQSPDLPTGPHRSADTDAIKPATLAGHALFERIGVGGMGEVYRCGDDAFGRDLAIKVIKADHCGSEDAERRFFREARVTGCLQHPGIVPIHNLGLLADGRPCYTMKLVRGRTFADILREKPPCPERLPHLLSIVEKICQAVAYAHSKGVIHRDLKPSNVMVGKFGEVQVMDWGLAKVLPHEDNTERTEAVEEEPGTILYTTPASMAEDMSRTGAAMGTPSYMPPEQAMGERELVDERADVFALGAILCELLTGFPPYRAGHRDELLRRARRGDLAEALGRLEQCGADAALMQVCRECLAAEREGRPRNADVVAKRLAAYQADTQERLRRAELERAAAEVKALEERKRRRLTLTLAALVLLLLTGSGAAFLWQQRQREQADLAVSNGLAQAEVLAKQARENPLQPDRYRQALEAARVAAQLAETASSDARRQAQELISHLEQEETAARKDRELLAALLDVRGPREGPKYQSDAKGTLMAMAEPTADEQFASAFRRWGLEVDGTSPAEAAALLKARPPAVVTELSAALDEWASERRHQGQGKEAWQRLLEMAALLDEEVGSKRRELRQIMARGRLTLERTLAVLSAALRPVPVPVEVALGPDRGRLRQLAEQTDAAREPILGLLTLVRALGVAGEESRAERLLRAAIVARPGQVVLHHTLGQLLASQQPPRWAEAAECYGAARTLRPNLGVNLAEALRKRGRDDEGLALLDRLVSETPTNPYLHFQLANALYEKGQLDEAMAEWRRAIALDPKQAGPRNNLGNALLDKGQVDEAMAEYRQAIELDPKDARIRINLGNALKAKGQLDVAMAEFRQAIELDPKSAIAHNSLGNALQAKGQLDEAMAEYRQAIALEPKGASHHYNLGKTLHDKGKLDEAVAEYRHTIRLKPDLAEAHCNLGHVLKQQDHFDEALAFFRRGHELGSKQPGWRYPSADWVRDAERLLVLGKKLPAILSGETKPANVQDLMTVARWATHHHQQFLATVRLLEQSLAANPDWSERLPSDPPCYYAACCAAMAAAGADPRTSALDAAARRSLRQQAVTWLGKELNRQRKQLAKGVPADRAAVAKALAYWKEDGWLAAVRDAAALAELPADEQQSYRKLWAEVNELTKQTAK